MPSLPRAPWPNANTAARETKLGAVHTSSMNPPVPRWSAFSSSQVPSSSSPPHSPILPAPGHSRPKHPSNASPPRTLPNSNRPTTLASTKTAPKPLPATNLETSASRSRPYMIQSTACASTSNSPRPSMAPYQSLKLRHTPRLLHPRESPRHGIKHSPWPIVRSFRPNGGGSIPPPFL